MEVWDYDADGKAVGRIPIPVRLTYKEKVIDAILKGNNKNSFNLRDNENALPMISIQWNGTSLDTERMKGMREKRHIYLDYATDNGSDRKQQKQHMDMQTVPYKLTFEVIIWAKYIDHVVQIAENIDSFIHPEIYLEYYEKGLGIGRKIKVVKTAESMGFTPEYGDDVRSKFITWSYNFEVECNLYKPEIPIGVPIKRVVLRYSAINNNNDVNLAEQTVSQTVDSLSSDSSGASGCFYDYDADIVNYIRKFSDNEQSQISEQYQSVLNCSLSPQDIVPSAITSPPILAYGEVTVSTTSNIVTITSSSIQNLPEYVPQATINSKINMPNFSIVRFENIQPGSFDVVLSSIPPDDTFSIVWNVYQKYNSNQNDV
jgi:hypothetical protein